MGHHRLSALLHKLKTDTKKTLKLFTSKLFFLMFSFDGSSISVSDECQAVHAALTKQVAK